MTTSFFSIIIPTYNRAHLLEKTIGTVTAQTYQDFEVIVVDDGSTDDTENVVDRLIRRSSAAISYVKQANSERAAARNRGLKQATGSYVLFFDSDDTLYENHLQVARDYIRQKSEPEFIHLRYDVKNDAGEVVSLGPVFESFPNKKLIRGNFLSCNGIFIRKDIALKNQFNEDRELSAMEDWELWLRLASQFPIHYVNTITSTVIDHKERSVVITRKQALINRIRLLIAYVTANEIVKAYYGKEFHRFRSSCYSYLSLHLSLTGKDKRTTLRYLIVSFLNFPGFLFQRRFYAIIKHLF